MELKSLSEKFGKEKVGNTEWGWRKKEIFKIFFLFSVDPEQSSDGHLSIFILGRDFWRLLCSLGVCQWQGAGAWLIPGIAGGTRSAFCLFCLAAVSTANANSSLNVLLFLGI